MVNRIMERAAMQSTPENVLRNLSLKFSGFFDFNEVDDLIFDRLHQNLKTRIEEEFRLFARANRSQFGSLRYANNPGTNSHGYTFIWQQRIADSLRRKSKAVND